MDAKLQITTHEEMIHPVCEFTHNWAISCGLDEKEARRLTIAVSELVSDIILYIYPDGEGEQFDITYRHMLSDIEIIIHDLGEPFDPDRHRYDSKRAMEDGNFDGAALRVIHHFCDKFQFLNKGKEGKKYHLSKSLQVHDFDDLINLVHSQESGQSVSQNHVDKHYTTEQISPSDAEDIAKLIYRTYRYSYAKEELYYPQKIEKTLKKKQKLGVITRTDKGTSAGYFAIIKKENANIAEVGEAVVSPKHRHHGIMNQMMQQLITTAGDEHLSGLFSKAVTIHTASQHVNNKFYYVTSALILAESTDVVFKGFDEEYPQPVSVVIDFLPLATPAERTVYLPKPYADLLEKTYHKLQIPFTSKEPTNIESDGTTDLYTSVDYSHNTATILVNDFGSNFEPAFSETLLNLESKESLNTIYIDLPLSHPATPKMTGILQQKGFIYCGLAPLFYDDSDYLRLQKVYASLEFDLIKVYSDFGKTIKSFIEDEYHQHTKN